MNLIKINDYNWLNVEGLREVIWLVYTDGSRHWLRSVSESQATKVTQAFVDRLNGMEDFNHDTAKTC